MTHITAVRRDVPPFFRIVSSLSVRALLPLIIVLGSAMVLAASSSAQGKSDYPHRPIRIVVPFPPGGATDTIARALSHGLNVTRGWTVVVENRPGAGGSIGVDLVSRAAGDGYTLLLGQTSNLTIGPSLYPNLPYDPEKDLAAITSIAAAPMVIVVPAASPYLSVADMLREAAKAPGSINFASSGNGSLGHLTAQQLQSAAKVKMQHIPYKGASQAMIDVMNGTVGAYFTSVPSVRDQIREGKLRALTVTSPARSIDFPNVPTLIEAGYDFEASAWFGLLAPASIKEEIITELSDAVNDVLQQPDFIARLASDGAIATGGSPEKFKETIRTELVRWAKVVHESGATVE